MNPLLLDVSDLQAVHGQLVAVRGANLRIERGEVIAQDDAAALPGRRAPGRRRPHRVRRR
jgi:hypothetical protein